MSAKKILINVFHPNLNESRGNKALIDAVSDLPNVTIRDLYAEYPDCEIDVAKEQSLLVDHDVIVFQHPLYWLSSPALFKQWQDTCLLKGFAFPPGEGTALAGKIWQTVLTTGGPAEGYKKDGPFKADFEDILIPFRLTSFYCSMKWQPPFAMTSVMPADAPGMRAAADEELAARATEYRALLESF